MMAQTKQAKHTPTITECLGRYGSTFRDVGSPQTDQANLTLTVKATGINHRQLPDLIIRAVNSHQELLGALQNVVYLLKAHADKSWNIDDAVAEAEKAIAHATGE